jgi:hypothetical protein
MLENRNQRHLFLFSNAFIHNKWYNIRRYSTIFNEATIIKQVQSRANTRTLLNKTTIKGNKPSAGDTIQVITSITHSHHSIIHTFTHTISNTIIHRYITYQDGHLP